jgi:hypothetical protein
MIEPIAMVGALYGAPLEMGFAVFALIVSGWFSGAWWG